MTSVVKLTATIALASALSLAPHYARATESEDIVVGIKTLPMLTDELTPPVLLAIIYDPVNPESVADAESIKNAVDSGVKNKNGTTIGSIMVPLNNIDKLSQAKIAYIAKGLKSNYDVIAQAANTHNVLTMSSDVECVRANKCILGITSKPVVEIYFSRAASEAANVGFDSAFIMLVKKV